MAAYNGSTFVVAGTKIGCHEADLEHITVRVDGTTEKVLEVDEALIIYYYYYYYYPY